LSAEDKHLEDSAAV